MGDAFVGLAYRQRWDEVFGNIDSGEARVDDHDQLCATHRAIRGEHTDTPLSPPRPTGGAQFRWQFGLRALSLAATRGDVVSIDELVWRGRTLTQRQPP